MVAYAALVHDPIDPGAVLARVGHPEDGAALLFVGVVRNHAEGKAVEGLTYEAYEEMAVEVLRSIAHEASLALGTDRIALVHRVGDLSVGEASVVVAVSSPHRAEAYEASRYVIEEIKKRLPVWKREHYEDGGDAWVRGRRPPPSAVTGPEKER